MKREDIAVKPNSVAILDYHDGGAGQVASWFEEVTGLHIACFVAASFKADIDQERSSHFSQRLELPLNNTFQGRPFLVDVNWAQELKKIGINKALPLSPNARERFEQVRLCRENNIELVSAIHPRATIMKDATIEPGVWINANTFIGYKVEIQSGVVIEVGSHIEHHSIVESCCQIDPGVTIAGNVALGQCCYVHMGASVINRKQIGADAIIGAGAVVLDDIPARCTAVGIPAKVIKRH